MQGYEETNGRTKSSELLRTASSIVLTSDTIPMVFVTGASRSGTTMLARVLGSHSAIFTFKELHYFGDLVEPQEANRKITYSQSVGLATSLIARILRGLWSNQPTVDERRIAKMIVDRLNLEEMTPGSIFAAAMRESVEAHGKHTACEQTGRNIFYAEQLLALYPNAKVVHIVRDPRAVLASQKNRWKMRHLGAGHLPLREMLRNRVNYHPFTITNLWVRANQHAMRLSKHPRFLIIRFEDLAADPEGRARQLCEFLKLDFEPLMIDIPLWGSSNLVHNSKQKGISKETVEKWREHLSISEAMICEKMTSNLMEYFSYTPEHLKKIGLIETIPFLLSFPLHVLAVLVLNPHRAWIQLKALAKVRHY